MITIFSKYVLQNVLAMVGISVYILADTFFISMYAGADGLAVLNLILPLYGLIYAIGAMIGIGSATGFSIKNARKERRQSAIAFRSGRRVNLIRRTVHSNYFASGAFIYGELYVHSLFAQ